jgi:hypothetical protein
MAVLQILLGFLTCAGTSLALGVAAMRLLRIEMSRGGTLCLGYVLGSAITSTLTLGLAFLWMAREGVFLGIAAGAAVLLWRNARWLRTLKATSTDSIPVALGVIFAVAWMVYGTLYFRQALSPEMSADGMSYHLGLVNLWNHAHGLQKNTRMYAALPDGVEMLFLFAFATGKHSAAALVHFSFLMLLPLLMVLYGCRFGWTRGGGVLAAILIFASPLFGVDGTAAYNDVALAAITFAAVYLLAMWREDRRRGTLIACCILAGFAFAVKYTGGFLILFVAAVLVWEMRHTPRRQAAGTVLAACALMLLPAVPYLIRNVIWFQNPIAFFGNTIFRNRWFHVSFEQQYVEGLSHLHGVTWRELPRELTLGGPKVLERFGPVFVLMPLALIGLIWSRTRLLVIAAAFAACGFAGNKSARFLMPSAPLLAMAAAFVLSKLPFSPLLAGAIVLVDLAISWPAVNDRLNPWHTWSLSTDVTWAAALRMVPEDQWLMRSDDYRVAQLIEERVPAGQTVFRLSGEIAQAYTTRPVLAPWESAFAEKADDLFVANGSSSTDWIPRWTTRFSPTRVSELDIVQTGKAREDDMWSVNEIRLLNGDRQLLRRKGWKLDAFPNPWDAGLAFDGLMATRWRSWETLRPGMWIRARFDPPEPMDGAEVICSGGPADKLVAFILDDRGEWRLSGEFLRDKIPPVDRRKEATQELKRRGIRYITILRQDWVDWFRGDYKGWGVHEIGSTRTVLLLQVD